MFSTYYVRLHGTVFFERFYVVIVGRSYGKLSSKRRPKKSLSEEPVPAELWLTLVKRRDAPLFSPTTDGYPGRHEKVEIVWICAAQLHHANRLNSNANLLSNSQLFVLNTSPAAFFPQSPPTSMRTFYESPGSAGRRENN